MKHYSQEEIKAFVETLCKDDYGCEIDFRIHTDKEVLFEVTQMYTSPIKLGFKELKQLSEFFETENVDHYNDISELGCETCDYDSKYGVAIRVWE